MQSNITTITIQNTEHSYTCHNYSSISNISSTSCGPPPDTPDDADIAEAVVTAVKTEDGSEEC